MKKKKYVFTAVTLFALSIIIFIYGLSTIGFFNKHKLLIKAIACHECPSHEVVLGGFKLSGQLPDSAEDADVTKIFLAGEHNPAEADYTKTYDYYIVTGKLTDVKRIKEEGPQYPVIIVSAWQEISFLKAFTYGMAILFLLILSIRFYRRFINANRVSILRESIMVNEDVPD